MEKMNGWAEGRQRKVKAESGVMRELQSDVFAGAASRLPLMGSLRDTAWYLG